MKFTTRDLLWATTFSAVLVAWSIDHESLSTGFRSQGDRVVDETAKRAFVELAQLRNELRRAKSQLADYERLLSEKASTEESRTTHSKP
jgi:hypothetical protein